VTDQGFWLGFAEIVADLSWFQEYLDRLDAVTSDDVQRAAERRLGEDQRTVGHYVPKKLPEGNGSGGGTSAGGRTTSSGGRANAGGRTSRGGSS
jgi:hypothetical protein